MRNESDKFYSASNLFRDFVSLVLLQNYCDSSLEWMDSAEQCRRLVSSASPFVVIITRDQLHSTHLAHATWDIGLVWNVVVATTKKMPLQVDGAPCVLEILDTAGTEQFASMRDLYIKNGHGFIVMYSLTNHQTFQVSLERQLLCFHSFASSGHCDRFVFRSAILLHSASLITSYWLAFGRRLSLSLQDISNMKNVISRVKGSQPAPILLVANKLDLDCQREVSREEGKSVSRTGTSAYLC